MTRAALVDGLHLERSIAMVDQHRAIAFHYVDGLDA
jgi:hypothetical protein